MLPHVLDHVTLVFTVPVTVAVSDCVPFVAMVAVGGETSTVTNDALQQPPTEHEVVRIPRIMSTLVALAAARIPKFSPISRAAKR